MERILITPRGFAKYGQECKKLMESKGYILDINDTGQPLSKSVFIEKAKLANGIIVGVDSLDKDVIEQCKNLKVIVKFGVGTDNIDLLTCRERNIKVGRCIGTNSNAVAEHTIGLMFAASKNIVSNVMEVKNGKWVKPTGSELLGKTVGIIGFGNIGKNVARIAAGIGMTVKGFDLFGISEEDQKKYCVEFQSVDEILKSCDFITLHIPLSPETKDFISTKEFKIMKKTAILINSARGGIVDEEALYFALKNKEIAACASDVFTDEPPKNEGWVADLIKMDNFLLTAHIASRSKEAEINTVNVATDTIIKLLEENGGND
ncbi:MAG: phosphoglycerate dehydrogenase [Bacilli bacterium]